MTPGPPSSHPHDDLAIYALDALDPGEHAAIEAHLAECEACRAELDAHRDTLSRLVVPDDEPPPSVWAGIAARLPGTGSAGGLVDDDLRIEIGPVPTPPPAGPEDEYEDEGDDARSGTVVGLHSPLHARRRGLAERGGWLAAAAALILVVGLGGVLLTRGGDGSKTVADLAAAAADAPDARVVTLRNDAGHDVARVVLTGETTDFVLFDDLATLPDGRSYQLWKTDAGAPVSLGVLGDGRAEAAAIAAPADIATLAITDEPAGGVGAPTGPTVASGQV
jgi:anti-sigma-K factor RskA